jgi:hypothetical protein
MHCGLKTRVLAVDVGPFLDFVSEAQFKKCPRGSLLTQVSTLSTPRNRQSIECFPCSVVVCFPMLVDVTGELEDTPQ